MNKWSLEEIELIRNLYKKYTLREIVPILSEKFQKTYSVSKLKSLASRLKIHSGRTGHFAKEHKPWNKGKTGYMEANKTSFAKSHLPHNTLPVGSEVVAQNNYLKVKIAMPKKWKFKHVLEWEKANHKVVPKGYVVIFADRNIRNFNPENLLLVSRNELVRLNSKHLIFENSEATKCGLTMAKIIIQTKKRQRTKQ